jgi:UDP-N-acetylglucosamine 2-epimerase (non-hydrolysing)
MEKPIILVVGTRPDALKLIPVFKKLRQYGVPTLLCATNQHSTLLDQVLTLLDVQPDISLQVMKENQRLDYLTTAVLEKTTEFFIATKPRLVIVQGDTTSSFAAALAAYYLKIPIAHIEAGLRTNDIYSPFPEEINRVFISKVSSLHFAPTPLNVLNLTNDGVPQSHIFCVGNTIVDTLFHIRQKIKNGSIDIDQNIKNIVTLCAKENKKLVLLTTHRRESFSGGVSNILKAVVTCANKHPNLLFFFPTHPNPLVQKAIALSGISECPNVICSQPVPYQDLVYLLLSAGLVLTDSGGIQEEAVSMGKPVFILRDTTERIEAIWDGCGKLLGTNYQNIIDAIEDWYKETSKKKFSQRFTYGEGNASQRIIDVLLHMSGTFVLDTIDTTQKPHPLPVTTKQKYSSKGGSF